MSFLRSNWILCQITQLKFGVIVGLIYWVSGGVVLAFPQQESGETKALDFASQVRPILSDRCFACHGPDAAQRATDLRLDDEGSVHQLAVVPGDADASELVRRIESSDPGEVMPPMDSKVQLTDVEKEILRRWVREGATFSKHWAFISPKAAELPELPELDSWATSNNGVDRWIGERLHQLGLQHSQEADRATLIRRVTLDLTGLLPTIDEIDAFENSTDPNAYEQLVDLLLADSHYGEKWATDWLDVARYADTHGYQADVYRATWPWRDWVVEALNRNLPYDQFVTWQLAGDLLPNPTQEQVLATAFNRNHRQTNEGGSVEEEFRAEYVADRVNTFGAAFLGLTLECARCHDHKYDPVTQREYYQLAAFFNSIDESGLYSHFTSAVPTPTLQLSTDQQAAKIAELKQAISAKENELRQLDRKAGEVKSSESLVRRATVSVNDVLARLHESEIAHYTFDEIVDGKFFNRVTGELTGQTADGPSTIQGVLANGLLFSGENSVTIPEGGKWTRNDAFSLTLWVNAPRHFDRCVVLHRSRAWTDAASRGYELLIEDGKLSAGLIHFWPGNAIRVVSVDPLPLDQWCHVAITYDGSSRASGLKLYVDGQPMVTQVVRNHLTQAIHGGEANELTIGQRFRDVGFKDGRVDDLRVFDAELSALEVGYLSWRGMSELRGPTLSVDQWFARVDGETAAEFSRFGKTERRMAQAELFELRNSLSAFSERIAEIMVMREMFEPRPTYVLQRGEYDAPGERVERALPSSIVEPASSNPSHAEMNRLDLARWLLQPGHPLTARVAVNRIWQALFGSGLVSTSEDFGSQGSAPTHPELLDWLAVRYIQSGWDTKALIKLIVMSHAYRQSSDLRVDLLRDDPDNRWLARGPAVRLSAEAVRDAALFASGLLVDRLGGPPVKPYQPEGLWEEKSGTAYHRDEGEGSHRRSLYTFWKRTSPPPNMMTFDASSREVCTVRRQSTMTPLQTLVLLNDPQFVEAARGLAERSMTEFSATEDRLSAIFCRLISRRPTTDQMRVLTQLYDEQLTFFQADSSHAEQFLSVGDHKANESLDKEELAALAVVAEGLMSYDEFAMKR